jgi:predicted enzyme related to lactoylglutathione lyase
MLRGLATVSFFADDIPAARDWYAELLGIQPYFVRPTDGPPVYVEFRLGDYEHELGIIDSRFAPAALQGKGPSQAGGAVTYWHVDDVQAAADRLESMGATVLEKPIERGPGFVTASAVDPFGNILGVMYNRHYLEILQSRDQA